MFAQFVARPEWVETQISGRRYRVEHVICEGAAPGLPTGSAVAGHGAYHFRHAGGLIGEDWDVFFPAG